MSAQTTREPQQKPSIVPIIRGLIEVVAAHLSGCELKYWSTDILRRRLDPAWPIMVKALERSGEVGRHLVKDRRLYDFYQVATEAEGLWRSTEYALGATNRGLSKLAGVNPPDGMLLPVQDLPAPDAPPAEWIERLKAQARDFRGPMVVPCGPSPMFPDIPTDYAPAELALRLIAAGRVLIGPSMRVQSDLAEWATHPDEIVRTALLFRSPARLTPELARSMVESAIRTGHRWTTTLEYLHGRTVTNLDDGFAEWKNLLSEHRDSIVRNSTDVRPFVEEGTPMLTFLTDLAERNEHLDEEALAALADGCRGHGRNALKFASGNPHVPMSALVNELIRVMKGEEYKGLSMRVIEPLRIMSQRPGGIPPDERLLPYLMKRIEKGLPASEVVGVLAVPGTEDHPILKARLRRERNPEVLAAYAGRAEPVEFGRLLGRILTSTAKSLEAGKGDRKTMESLVKQVIERATPEQLRGVPKPAWTRALGHPSSSVRLAAQMAIVQAAQETSGAPIPEDARAAHDAGQERPGPLEPTARQTHR